MIYFKQYKKFFTKLHCHPNKIANSYSHSNRLLDLLPKVQNIRDNNFKKCKKCLDKSNSTELEYLFQLVQQTSHHHCDLQELPVWCWEYLTAISAKPLNVSTQSRTSKLLGDKEQGKKSILNLRWWLAKTKECVTDLRCQEQCVNAHMHTHSSQNTWDRIRNEVAFKIQ